ncbi:MAG: hypothetical protein F6J93_03660 [Oscillatoria sp. SIO1A7]|nr:hypothetical protein [Oscillatoria sp. SIO1A7]
MGLPQNRKRLIWRAVADELSCKLRAGAALAPGLFGQKFWFGLEPKKELHSGWYSAVADLLEKESESHLADWQMRMVLDSTALAESSLPALLPRAGANVKKFSIRSSEQPSPTVRALELSRTWHLFDALLACFQRKECYSRSPSQPSIAIAASQQKRSWKVLQQQDDFKIKVKALSPRAIARLQGVSDSYKLIGTKSQQVTILGNRVPPLLIEKMWRPVLDAVA